MKLTNFFLILIAFASFLLTPAAWATYEDYLLRRDHYFQSHQEYLTAKQRYLNQKTLQTKEIFAQKLKEFLISRDNLSRSYLFLLTEEGARFLGDQDLEEIRAWINWLNGDIGQINSLMKTEDFLSSAKELEANYPEMEKAIFVFLTRLTVSQQKRTAGKIGQLADEIGKSLEEKGSKESIAGWLNEVALKLESAEESQKSALELIRGTRARRIGDILRDWEKVKSLTGASNSDLKEALGFLNEIIKRLD